MAETETLAINLKRGGCRRGHAATWMRQSGFSTALLTGGAWRIRGARVLSAALEAMEEGKNVPLKRPLVWSGGIFSKFIQNRPCN
jgi:hypothetical protein